MDSPNIIRYEWPKDLPVPRAEKDDRGVHAERADAVQSRIRAQYQKDRRPLAEFLQEHFPDKELLERFWWYRNEEEEIRVELNLPRKRGWERVNEVSPKL